MKRIRYFPAAIPREWQISPSWFFKLLLRSFLTGAGLWLKGLSQQETAVVNSVWSLGTWNSRLTQCSSCCCCLRRRHRRLQSWPWQMLVWAGPICPSRSSGSSDTVRVTSLCSLSMSQKRTGTCALESCYKGDWRRPGISQITSIKINLQGKASVLRAGEYECVVLKLRSWIHYTAMHFRLAGPLEF